MELTEFSVSLLYLAIPGIVCYFIAKKLTGVSSDNSVHQVLAMFLFAVLSYGMLAALDGLANYLYNDSWSTDLKDIVIGKAKSIQLDQLMRGVGASILVAFLLSYGHRFNVVNFAGQTIRATLRYGDEDVWHFFHNAPAKDKNDGWVFVRDHTVNLSYHCSIPTWSDTGRDREMVLSDVTVFANDSGLYLYKCKLLYLCRNKADISIEVPIDNASQYPEYRIATDTSTKGDRKNDEATTNQ